MFAFTFVFQNMQDTSVILTSTHLFVCIINTYSRYSIFIDSSKPQKNPNSASRNTHTPTNYVPVRLCGVTP
ncbi:hypothetical protein L2E82_22184 [Cichorium intybus]|uniref:Uncharacterized protein n=1 Tax=Cichorium intybus TaxID=13427 RepID=A0ACB9DXH2_CICIN|nr:hypothetical protein L2E82_22184 [Cichorium intybus]